MNKFLKEFKERGFFYQCTNEYDLSQLLDKKKLKLILDLIVLPKVFMSEVCYRLCVLDYFRNMDINQ